MMKTLNQLIEEGFTYPETIDEPTATLITDWFGERYTGYMFTKFFDRSLNLYYPYYRQLLRVDPTVSSFDWFVDNYEERQSNVNEAGRNTLSKVGNTSTDDHTTVTNTGTVGNQVHRVEDGGDQTVYNSNMLTENADANNSRVTAVSRVSPMSSDYSSSDLRTDSLIDAQVRNPLRPTQQLRGEPMPANDGGIVRPEITNPSSVGDTLSENSQTSLNSATHQGEDTVNHDMDITETATRTDNLSQVTSGTVTASTTGTDTGTSSIDRLLREIRTGRNQDLSTLIDKAVLTIQNTVAWEWLYKNLDKCFIQTYIVKGDEYEQ